MINVRNKFKEDDLEIKFSGESIANNSIIVSVQDDVNFKPVIDYLINLIPHKEQLESNFEDYSEEENHEKLNIIEETIEDIYDAYNESIDNNQEPDL